MKVIFILALAATMFALTTAYYQGGEHPKTGLLGGTNGYVREWDSGPQVAKKFDEDEELQKLKIKDLVKEIGRKVIIPKVIDKLQNLEEGEGEDEFQKLKIGKVLGAYVIPRIIAALDETANDRGTDELVVGHLRRRKRDCFPKWKCRT